jgi:hypothetical protein
VFTRWEHQNKIQKPSVTGVRVVGYNAVSIITSQRVYGITGNPVVRRSIELQSHDPEASTVSLGYQDVVLQTVDTANPADHSLGTSWVSKATTSSTVEPACLRIPL